MLYAVITFGIGIVIGGGVTQRLAKQYWQRRLKETRQALLARYMGDIQAEARQRETAERIKGQLEKSERVWLTKEEGWTKQEQALAGQLSALKQNQQKQKQDQERWIKLEQNKVRSLEAQLKKEQCQWQDEQENYKRQLEHQQSNHLKLQIEHNKHREDMSASIQSSLEVERKNTALNHEVERLRDRLKKSEIALEQSEKAHTLALTAAAQEADLNLSEIVEKLFPNVELLRDSVAQLSQHKRDFGTVLAEIQTLVQHRKHTHFAKVRATQGKWSECRAGKMGRIYYRKTATQKYKILISWKKNEKSQKKDIEWLKHQ